MHDFNPMEHVRPDTDDELEHAERQGRSIKDSFNRQALRGRRELESLKGAKKRLREEEVEQSHVRAIAKVANMEELASRSWNVGDRVEIDTMPDGSRNVIIRFLRKYHGDTGLTKGDIWFELRGG